MSRTGSPSAGRPCGLAHACRVLEFPRSKVYAARARRRRAGAPGRAGPTTA